MTHDAELRRLSSRVERLSRMLWFVRRKIANSSNFPVSFALSDEDTKTQRDLIEWWKNREQFDD